MLNWPKDRKEWIVAGASAFTGFFFGGAAIALVQRWLRKVL